MIGTPEEFKTFCENTMGFKPSPVQMKIVEAYLSGNEFRYDCHRRSGKSQIHEAIRRFNEQYGIVVRNADISNVDRFEVIDHRQCVWCRGRKTAQYSLSNGEYEERVCDRCNGSGLMGGRVYSVSSNPERSMVSIELSFQDDGKTLKVFVNDRSGDE